MELNFTVFQKLVKGGIYSMHLDIGKHLEIYYSMMENSSDAFAIHRIETEKTRNLVFVYVNASFERFFHLKKYQIIEETVDSLLNMREKKELSLLKIYKHINLQKHNAGMEVYIEESNKWYFVNRINIDHEYFALIFCDITEKKLPDKYQSESNLFNKKILDQFPNPIWLSGIDGKCSFFNKGWLEFTGRTIEEEIGDGWAEGVHPEDLERCFNTYMHAFNERNSFAMEYRLMHNNGRYRWILDNGSPIYEENGDFAGYIGTCYDIHDARQLEDEVNSLTQEYETIFNGTQDPMFLIDVDRYGNYKLRRTNLAYENLIGLSTDMVKGRTLKEVLGNKVGSQLEAGYAKCLDTKSVVSYEETLAITTVERTWHTVLSPIIKDGRVVQIVGARRDITKIKEMENKLFENEERYRSLFENNHMAMLLINPESGDLFDVNPAAIRYYGYTRAELMRMKITDINMLSYAQVYKKMEDSLQEIRRHFYFQHRLANGEIRDVEVYSGPITIGGKQLLYSIVHDITDRKKAENELFNEKELFRVTVLSMGDGLLTTDTEGRIKIFNKAAEEITGWKMQRAIGKPSSEVFHIINGYTGTRREDPIMKILKTENKIELEENTVLITKNLVKKEVADSGAPIRDNMGNILGAVLVFRDITEERHRLEKIEYLGLHDSLTGLYNRAFLEKELNRLDVPGNLPLSLIIGDVNGLKITNDAFGHEAGDRLLKKIADILQSECRNSDIAARTGGDEFVILLSKTGFDETERIVNRIIDKCKNEEADPIKPSISLGAAVKDNSDQDINFVYKIAEDRMYSSKLMESKSIRSSIISSLRKTLNERTHETEEHSTQFLELTKKLGKALRLSTDKVNNLQLLAMFHDIGITAIPDQVLHKKGELTPKEQEVFQSHSEIGYRIACASPEHAHMANDILHHHENWDGSGYPGKLAGESIPLNARIIAVLDTYDSLVRGNFYQVPVGDKEARNHIKKWAGIHFDPQIVSTFLKILGCEK